MKPKNKKIIGIVGGMGPLAGVRLQELIIEETKAANDQEHTQVICFTDPQIPDRTKSLAENDGRAFIVAIQCAAQKLTSIGASVIAIPCITAHTRFKEIAQGVRVPIIDIVSLTMKLLRQRFLGRPIGILGTSGTLKERLFQNAVNGDRFSWVLPDHAQEQQLMQVIYGIKMGHVADAEVLAMNIAQSLQRRGAEVILLGCTELSLIQEKFRGSGIQAVDPLRIAAKELSTIVTSRFATRQPVLL